MWPSWYSRWHHEAGATFSEWKNYHFVFHWQLRYVKHLCRFSYLEQHSLTASNQPSGQMQPSTLNTVYDIMPNIHIPDISSGIIIMEAVFCKIWFISQNEIQVHLPSSDLLLYSSSLGRRWPACYQSHLYHPSPLNLNILNHQLFPRTTQRQVYLSSQSTKQPFLDWLQQYRPICLKP
jgi:hypothetical protein